MYTCTKQVNETKKYWTMTIEMTQVETADQIPDTVIIDGDVTNVRQHFSFTAWKITQVDNWAWY